MGNTFNILVVLVILVYHADTNTMSISVILHNIRSAHNVGSIFRSADGAGVSKIYLTGYTPTPIDRFGRENKEIKKTSLGANETVLYEVMKSPIDLIKELKKDGKEIIAVEQTNTSGDYRTTNLDTEKVFIFGNEVTGIEEEVLAISDTHIEIPMAGIKESLNVSVCAGIILFHFIE